MILRKIRVEHIRRHIRPVEVVFNERFTVIEGPNETGKSTLFTALEYAFFRRSSATGDDVKSLEPWSAEGLRPRITVDFFLGSQEYRLEKNWSGRGSTLISTLDAAGQPTPYKSEDADDWLLSLFAGEAGAQGFRTFKASHLGLAHLLFAPQGRVLIRGKDDEVKLNDDAHGRLASLVGAVSQTADEVELIDTIRRAREEFWEKKRGKRKTDAPSNQKKVAVQQMEGQLASLEGSRLEFIQVGESYQAERTELDLRRRERTECTERFAQLMPRLRAAADARLSFERAQRNAIERKRIFDEVAGRVANVVDLLTRREVYQETVVPCEAAFDIAQLGNTAALEVAAKAGAALGAASESDPTIEAKRKLCFLAQRAETSRVERDQLKVVVSECEKLDFRLGELSGALLSEVPTADQLERLTHHRNRILEIRALLRSAQTTIKIHALQNLTVESGEESSDLKAGQIDEFVGDLPVVTIAGVVRIEARGPIVDVGALRGELATIEGELLTFETRFTTSDYAELVRRATEVTAIDRERGQLKDRRDALLAGRDYGELHQRIAELDANITAADGAGDLALLESELQRIEAERQRLLNEARAAFDAASANATEARTTLSKAERELAEAKRRVDMVDAEVKANLSGSSLDDLREKRREEELKWSESSQEEARAKDAYAPFADLADPAGELQDLERQREALQHIVDERESSVARLQERFERLQREGISQRIAELEQYLADAQAAASLAAIDEDAIDLLFHTVEAALSRRAEGLTAPIAARIAPWFERVTGRSLVGIRLGKHHEIEGLRLSDVARDVRIEELSAGVADQLGALARLAFADLLATKEALPVLLDDPLVNADRARRSAMLAIMREVSEKAQIIVFTCRSEDYLSSGAVITRIGEVETTITSVA